MADFDDIKNVLNNDDSTESEEVKKEVEEVKQVEQKPMQTEKKLNFNVTIIIVALIIAFAYIYTENGKIAYQEKIRAEKETQQRHQQNALANCLDQASRNYDYNWNNACKDLKKKEDCSLPSYRAQSIEKWRTDERNECMNKFKSGAFND